MVGRQIKYTKLITLCARAAAKCLLAVFPAVFFALPGYSSDSALCNFENSMTELVFELSRSVVTVEVSHQLPTNRFGSPTDQTFTRDWTSGIIIDTSGRVLVAARAVLGQEKLVVRTGQMTAEAEIIAVDFQTELALLQTNLAIGPPVTISSRHACAGQMILAVSRALGQRSSPSLGFCAGGQNDGTMRFSLFGPEAEVGTGIFDLSGQLVGFVTSGVGREQNIVMAIPGYRLPEIVNHLVNNGDRQSGFAGITSQEIEISPGIPLPYPAVIPASAAGRTAEVIERGVVITSVVPLSPAERAGIMIGDLIYAIDGMPVNSAAGLANLVRQSAPGTRFELDLLRQHHYLNIPITVGRKSLDLGMRPSEAGSPPSHLADSLRQALRELQEQMDRIERRLKVID